MVIAVTIVVIVVIVVDGDADSTVAVDDVIVVTGLQLLFPFPVHGDGYFGC